MTPETLKALLSYDPLSGVFTWRGKPNGRVAHGARAGSAHNKGYRHIRINGRLYLEHVLAVLYTHGVMHDGEIDHINGNRSDNRLENLRRVDKSINLQNQRKAHKGSASGLLGAHKHGSNWRAVIKIRGERVNIGTFSTAEEAHTAYLKAKRDLHEGCTI